MFYLEDKKRHYPIEYYEEHYVAAPSGVIFCYSLAAYLILVTLTSVLHTESISDYFLDVAKSFRCGASSSEVQTRSHFAVKLCCVVSVLLLAHTEFEPPDMLRYPSLAVFVFSISSICENPESLGSCHCEHQDQHHDSDSSNSSDVLKETAKLHSIHSEKKKAATSRNLLHAQEENSRRPSNFEVNEVHK